MEEEMRMSRRLPAWEKKLEEISESMTSSSILMFYIFALVDLVVGANVSFAMLPDQSALEPGYYYKIEAYVPAVMAVLIAVFAGVFLIWMGQVLHYLRKK